MIKINLLPQATKTRKTTFAPFILVGVIVVTGIVISALYLVQNGRMNAIQKDIDVLEKKKAELKPKMESMEKELDLLEKKKQAINQLAGQDQFLWAPKLNELANIVPENVKFTRISVENKNGVDKLKLEGVTYSKTGEERVALIGKLMNSLKEKGFYDKKDGSPNFGEIEFVQTTSDEQKDTGWLINNFVIEMQII